MKETSKEILSKVWLGQLEFGREIEAAFENYLKKAAFNFYRKCYLQRIDVEDLYNIGLFAIHKAIRDYRLICGECGERFITPEEYSKHCIKAHGRSIAPAMQLTSYVYYRVEYEMRTTCQQEIAAMRNGKITIHSIDGIPDKNTQKWQSELMIIDLLENLMKEFDELEKEIINRLISMASYVEITRALQEKNRKNFNQNYHIVIKTVKRFREKFTNANLAA